MQKETISIPTAFYDALLNKLRKEMTFSIQMETTFLTLLTGEDYSFRTNSDQMFIIAIERNSDSLLINIICGGGGEGLLRWSLGSESSFIDSTLDILRDFCQAHSIVMKKMD